jgi:hypothetical protein
MLFCRDDDTGNRPGIEIEMDLMALEVHRAAQSRCDLTIARHALWWQIAGQVMVGEFKNLGDRLGSSDHDHADNEQCQTKRDPPHKIEENRPPYWHDPRFFFQGDMSAVLPYAEREELPDHDAISLVRRCHHHNRQMGGPSPGLRAGTGLAEGWNRVLYATIQASR